MATAAIGDVELFFTDDGAPHGMPVLLVHGWTCDSHDWAFQLGPLSVAHRVIAADLRGHGRSSVPESGYDPRTFAADLAALLRRLGTGPVVAVGHSLGGMIVAALAVEHPDVVRATVAVDPAYGMDEARAGRVAQLLVQLGTPEGGEVLSGALAATETQAPDWLRHWHRRRAVGNPPQVVRAVLHGMYLQEGQFGVRPQADAFLAGRPTPVLALHRSAELAAWEAAAFRHPYSRSVTWDGIGHWLHQERPAEFNALLMEWISGLPS